jgi:hypothetical protein
MTLGQTREEAKYVTRKEKKEENRKKENYPKKVVFMFPCNTHGEHSHFALTNLSTPREAFHNRIKILFPVMGVRYLPFTQCSIPFYYADMVQIMVSM